MCLVERPPSVVAVRFFRSEASADTGLDPYLACARAAARFQHVLLEARRSVPADACDHDARREQVIISRSSSDFGRAALPPFDMAAAAARASGTAAPILAILGAHEMGHYLACRHYKRRRHAAVLHPAHVPAAGPDRHARRRHPHPRGLPDPHRAVRRRRRRPDRRLRRAAAGALLGHVPVARRAAPPPRQRICHSASRCCSSAPSLDRVRPDPGRPDRSTCTRWCSRRGSGCWRRRSTCCRSASSTAATSPTRRSAAGRRRSRIATVGAARRDDASSRTSWIADDGHDAGDALLARPAPSARHRRVRAARARAAARSRSSRS